jgi:methylase of polypeptide subunit release factors
VPKCSPEAGDGETLRRFGEFLAAANYPPQDVRAALDEDDPLRGLASVRPDVLADRSLAVLTRLFFLGRGVAEDEAARELAPLSLDALAALGVVEIVDGEVRSPVLVDCYEGLLLVSDRARDQDQRSDFVTGVNPTSRTLARLTVRRRVRSALDLGAACGVQALLAARDCTEVTATDINPRALEFAVLNARLNGLEHVCCAPGSWFSPVQGRQFDLVVSNPPFVVSPDTAFLYRDSELPADGVSELIITQAPRYLTEGGMASIMCNWITEKDGDWAAPLNTWVKGRGCDALFLRYTRQDPVPYAAAWNQQLRGDPPRFEEVVRRWADYYRRERIEEISGGVVVLRRRSAGQNWVVALEASGGPGDESGAHLERIFDQQDYLDTITDEALLERPLALLDGHQLDQRLSFRDGQYVVEPTTLRFPSGIGVEGQIDPQAVPVLLACDGVRTLRDLLRETTAPPDIEADQLQSTCLAMAKHLLARGLLL